MKVKRQRLLTHRYEDNKAFEFIEMEETDGKQYLYWRCGETISGTEAEGCFPVSVDIVSERFKELNRTYVPSGKEVAKVFSDLLVKQQTWR